MWTKKHDKFALAVNLSGCQSLVLRDIFRKTKLYEPTEIEIDLRKTNKWIGRDRWRGQYHRKTIQGAIAALDEKTMGMVTIIKKYTPWVYKILVRPLSFLERIKSAKCGSMPKPNGCNPMYSEEHKNRAREQQQQNISKIKTTLEKVGLNFDPLALNRIWRYAGKSVDNLKSAVELLLYRRSLKAEDEPMNNPQGYLMDILKKGYYKDFSLYYNADLPYFKSGEQIANFVSSIMPKIDTSPPPPA